MNSTLSDLFHRVFFVLKREVKRVRMCSEWQELKADEFRTNGKTVHFLTLFLIRANSLREISTYSTLWSQFVVQHFEVKGDATKKVHNRGILKTKFYI